MSRVAKIPVAIAQGVEVKIADGKIVVKGAKGELSTAMYPGVAVAVEDGHVSFKATNDLKETNAMSGTLRALVHNMVVGVSKGFSKKLTLVGVGYKSSGSGRQIESVSRILPPCRSPDARRHQG